MDKMKRFIDIYIPTETCNLRCYYCYVAQKRKFNAKLAKFSHTPAEIREALSQKRLGGACLLNLCAGGETLLSEDVLPVVKELLTEGHYVMIVTNGTLTNRFEEVATWPKELLARLFFKFSFHFLEMKRLGWIDRFADSVQRVKAAGASFTVEVTPSDELIPYIDELKETCLEKFGALCHLTIARDDRTGGIDILSAHSFDEYKRIWGQFDSALFDLKCNLYHRKISEFCYAGEWSAYLNLETGRLAQCYCGQQIDNIYENVDKPIHFKAVGKHCSLPYCYNGHAFLALGDVPGIDTVTYADTRNRVCKDESEWLKPEMKEFMSFKLKDNNKEYTSLRIALGGVEEMQQKATRKAKTILRRLF